MVAGPLRRGVALAALVASTSAALAGCSTDGTDSAATGSTTLSVYLGLPLQGPSAAESDGLAQGAKLALAQAGGRVGPFTVKVAVLDDSTGAKGTWDAATTSEVARRVIRDRTTVAYIGDADAGATAISLPLTNAAGILQVAPRATYAGLTTAQGGAPGEPDRFRPSGRQSLVRVVPQDAGQVRALVAAARERGCRRVALVADRGLGPLGLVRSLDAALGDRVASSTVVAAPDEVAATVRTAAAAPCALYAAGPSPWSAGLLDDLHAAARGQVLLGSDGVASAGVLAALGARTQAALTVATPAPVTQPAAFAAAYRAAYEQAPTPTAVYGYEAMQVVLRGIRDAGPDGGNRRAVMSAAGRGVLGGLALGPARVLPGGDLARGSWSLGAVRDGSPADLRAAPDAGSR